MLTNKPVILFIIHSGCEHLITSHYYYNNIIIVIIFLLRPLFLYTFEKDVQNDKSKI